MLGLGDWAWDWRLYLEVWVSKQDSKAWGICPSEAKVERVEADRPHGWAWA